MSTGIIATKNMEATIFIILLSGYIARGDIFFMFLWF